MRKSDSRDIRQWLWIYCERCGGLGIIPRDTELYKHNDLTICVSSNAKDGASFISWSDENHKIHFMTRGNWELFKAYIKRIEGIGGVPFPPPDPPFDFKTIAVGDWSNG
jgi:hypothetical protein